MAALPAQGSTPYGAASPYNLILEHVFSKPLAYDIPLRSMFAINSASLDHHPAQQNARQNTQRNARLSTDHIRSKQDASAAANAEFQSALLHHIATLPSQPCSLPRAFTVAFLRKCFTSDLALVDFSQALTGIDYLKDLDNLRKRELAATLQRIGVDRADISSLKVPTILAWVQDTEEKEKKVDALYAQLFIGLRRWVRPGSLTSSLMIDGVLISKTRSRPSSPNSPSYPFTNTTATPFSTLYILPSPPHSPQLG